MAIAELDTGLGASITFSGLVAPWTSIEFGGQTIEALDASSLASTGFIEKLVSDLADAGTVTVQYHWDTADDILTIGTTSSLTVTFPKRTGEATAANMAGTAIVTDVTPPALHRGEIQVGSVTFEWDGYTGPTYTKGVAST